MQELKRIINYKRIILLLIAATVNVVFFLYDNKPVMDEDIINKENVAHETYIKNYHEEVNAIIDNADKLKKYSIFNKAGSFSYANILQTARDFERVKNVILPEDEYKGVQAYTTYYYQYFFTMLVMMFVIYDMFAQRDNGMWSITYSCANGRIMYAIKQTGVIVVTGAFTHTLIYWSTFIAAMLQRGGVRDLVNPVQTIETFDKFTYIECQLETGRTHQIRVHMKSIGHPILGDDVYGPAKCPFPGLEGQTLHAMTIGFLHPTTGNYMEFEAPLPDYFEQLLKKLRGLP